MLVRVPPLTLVTVAASVDEAPTGTWPKSIEGVTEKAGTAALATGAWAIAIDARTPTRTAATPNRNRAIETTLSMPIPSCSRERPCVP
jgi:hypothetical protein